MKWPKFNAYDFFIIIAVLILDIYLITNWSTFACPAPINWWLLVDYNLMLSIRFLFVLKYSNYSEQTSKVLNIILYLVLLPLTLAWVALGFIWQAGNINCIPVNMVPWSYLLWLGFTFIGALFLIGMLINDVNKYRKLRQYMNKMEQSLLVSSSDTSDVSTNEGFKHFL